MNQLVKHDDKSFDAALCELETTQKMCKALMQTKHYAAMGEPGVFAIVQKAKSLGMPTLEALNGGLYFVNGKVGMSTESMASMIRSRGHSIIKDPKSCNNICILHGKRADNGDTWTVSFSVDDAKRAGLFKNVFEKYPAVMCYNRACSMLARQLFPDVIKGAGYCLEELKEIAENFPALDLKITTEQADELIAILEYCDDSYRDAVLKSLKKSPYNCETLFDLPSSLYERLKMAAIKKKEEAQNVINVKQFDTEILTPDENISGM